MRLRLLSRRRRTQDGAAAVEFALVFAFVLVPTLMGMLQYGWYFYATQNASNGAREVARRLSVGDCQTGSTAQTLARNVANFETLTLTFGSTSAPSSKTLPPVGQVLRVTTQVNGQIIQFLPMPDDGQITKIVDVRVEDNTQDSPCP